MKSVLISIKPKYCELIANGEKTIEVRKTRPKIDVPFKCYIYCTKDKHGWFNFEQKTRLDGKVIGEFVCDRIDEFSVPYPAYFSEVDNNTRVIIENACLKPKDIHSYNGTHQTYAWHISDLVIYDEPKELGEFYQIGMSNIDYCTGCIYHETPACEFPCYLCNGDRKYLYRPPQSWCYVEEKESD